MMRSDVDYLDELERRFWYINEHYDEYELWCIYNPDMEPDDFPVPADWEPSGTLMISHEPDPGIPFADNVAK